MKKHIVKINIANHRGEKQNVLSTTRVSIPRNAGGEKMYLSQIEDTGFHQNALDRGLAPFVLSPWRLDAQPRQLLGDGVAGKPRDEIPEDQLDGLGLLRVHHQVAVLALIITDEGAVRDADLAVRHALAMPPGDVLRNAPAFFLRKAGHDGDEQFAFGIEGPDILIFNKDLRVVCLQLADGGKAVHRVPGKAAHRLRYDEVDFPGKRIGHHRLEALALFGAGSRDALVRIHTGKFPILMPFDERSVIIKLRLMAQL